MKENNFIEQRIFLLLTDPKWTCSRRLAIQPVPGRDVTKGSRYDKIADPLREDNSGSESEDDLDLSFCCSFSEEEFTEDEREDLVPVGENNVYRNIVPYWREPRAKPPSGSALTGTVEPGAVGGDNSEASENWRLQSLDWLGMVILKSLYVNKYM